MSALLAFVSTSWRMIGSLISNVEVDSLVAVTIPMSALFNYWMISNILHLFSTVAIKPETSRNRYVWTIV